MIPRYKSALKRRAISAPMRAITPLIQEGHSILDYGCGYGYDVDHLKGLGHKVTGYDPYFGKMLRVKSDWVLLFYVLNVIEDAVEREAVLVDAYNFADHALAIALHYGGTKGKALGDGSLTKRGTFWTDYSPRRAKALIRAVLGVNPNFENPCYWLPAGYADPILPYHGSESERLELIDKVEYEIEELRRSPLLLGEDVFLQKWWFRGKNRYRLFSPSRSLKDGVMFAYAGSDEPLDWVIEGLSQRDRLWVLQDRLEYLRCM